MKIRVQELKHPRYKWEVVAPEKFFGKRIRKPFKTKAEATAEKVKLENQYLEQKEGKLDPDVRQLMQRYQKLLSVDEIQEALDAKVEHLGRSNKTFGEIGEEFIERLKGRFKKGNISKDHLKDFVTRVPMISKWLGDPKLKDITEDMLIDFVDVQLESIGHFGKKKSPRTVKNYINAISGVMNYAIKKGYISTNVATLLDKEKYKSEVGILTPDEIRKLLAHANYRMTCVLMFGLFGGLRSSEIRKVNWDDIDLEGNEFYIKGEKNDQAKRYIQLTAPLKEWCEKMIDAGHTGLVLEPKKEERVIDERTGKPINEIRERLINYERQKLAEAAGVVMPRNCLRHSFGSYHVSKFKNKHVTANEMGHGFNSDQLMTAYKAAVKSKHVEDYWTIRAEVVTEEDEVAQIAA